MATNNTNFIEKIKEMRAKIMVEMKSTKEKTITFNNTKKQVLIFLKQKIFAALSEFNDFESDLISSKGDLENRNKINNENILKLDIERNLLNSAVSAKEKEISEMEHLVLNKVPQEFGNFEFLFKKELEIHNKMKIENNSIFSKNESITTELKGMIKIYKEISQLDLEKTKEGFLKVSFFRNLKHNKLPEGAYVIIEIKEGNFKLISYYPLIKVNQYADELLATNNFTLFLTNVANEFLKFINPE